MKSPEKMPLLHLGIPLSPDDYKQVGQITAMFGYIEMYVDMTMMTSSKSGACAPLTR